MSYWMKGLVAALLLGGSTLVASEPAQARVSVGIGIGIPGPGYYGPGYGYGRGYGRGDVYCDRYSRWYDPYRCDAEYYGDDDYYDGPVFIDGFWFDGRYRHRHHRDHDEFFFRDRWHEGRMGHRDHDGGRHFGGGEGHHEHHRH